MRMVFSADLGMFSQGTMTQKVLIGIPANPANPWPLSNHCRMLDTKMYSTTAKPCIPCPVVYSADL